MRWHLNPIIYKLEKMNIKFEVQNLRLWRVDIRDIEDPEARPSEMRLRGCVVGGVACIHCFTSHFKARRWTNLISFPFLRARNNFPCKPDFL